MLNFEVPLGGSFATPPRAALGLGSPAAEEEEERGLVALATCLLSLCTLGGWEVVEVWVFAVSGLELSMSLIKAKAS